MVKKPLIVIALLIVGASVVILMPRQQIGPEVLDIPLTDVDGNKFTLSDFRGRVIVLEFMTTRCPLCVDEIDHLRSVEEKYGDQITIILVSVDVFEKPDQLKEYMDRYNIGWKVAKDEYKTESGWSRSGDMTHEIGVRGTPTIVIFDREGNINHINEGLMVEAALTKNIDQLLT